MEQNIKNLRIFDDGNQNRFYTDLSVVSIRADSSITHVIPASDRCSVGWLPGQY